MKKIIYFVCFLIILTVSMILYVHKNYPDNIMEICLSEYIPPKTIDDAIGETGVYDYTIVYDLFSKEENAKVYSGNLNILINNKKKDNLNLKLNDNEIIIGDKYVKKNYAYNPLGEKYITSNGEYKINGIMSDSSDIYYKDLTILEKVGIKNQRLYIVLKDKDNNAIDENTLVSQLGSNDIMMSSVVCYGNIKKLLMKILILMIMVLIIYCLLKLCKILKEYAVELIKKYSEFKYDLYFKQFLLQPENIKDIKSITVSLISIIMLVISIIFLTVKYINFRMPYKLNPVSPKSIYEVISSFFDLIGYYIKNGMTEISVLILSLIVLYFIAIAVILVMSIIGKGKNIKINLVKIWNKL